MPFLYPWVRECEPPIGVGLVDRDGTCYVVSVDIDGVIQSLGTGDRRQLARAWSRAWFRVYPDLSTLLRDLAAGRCLGLVPDMFQQSLFPF